MTNTPKSSLNVNPVGGEGGSPGMVEVEASETLTETVTLKADLSAPTSVTNPTGGEGGSVG